jgi:Bacterial SH3 domain
MCGDRHHHIARISGLIVLAWLCLACSVPPSTLQPAATPITAATATVTPAPTSTPVPPPTATPSPTPAPTETPEPAATPTRDPDARVYAVTGVALDDVLNVRAGPGIEHPIVGTLPPYGTGIEVTHRGESAGGATWVPIRRADLAGWVNSAYLARQVGQTDERIAARAAEIVLAIQAADMKALSRMVHPEKGIRFSPYTHVQTEPGSDGDRAFSAAQIRDIAADRTVYHWGRYDGVGNPIDLTFAAYWDRFVYDADFSRPEIIGYDAPIGRGNTIDNIAEVHPEAITIEYHFSGFDPAFEGLDWRSLRLVVQELAGTWYLVGIVHDEWTI